MRRSPPPPPLSSPVISPLPGPALCIPPLPYFFLSSISSSSSVTTLPHYYLAFLLFYPSTSFSLFSSSSFFSSHSTLPLLYPLPSFPSHFFLLSILSCTIAFSVFSLYCFLSSSRTFYSSSWHPLTSLRPAFPLPSRSPGPPRLHSRLSLIFSFSSFSSSSYCTSCAFFSDSYSFSSPAGKLGCQKLETWNTFQILAA